MTQEYSLHSSALSMPYAKRSIPCSCDSHRAMQQHAANAPAMSKQVDLGTTLTASSSQAAHSLEGLEDLNLSSRTDFGGLWSQFSSSDR